VSGRELRFEVTAEVVLRRARREDLRPLEWFGRYTPHREIIRSAFEAQERGENLMLLAEMNGFPIAQAWVDLERGAERGIGLLWAVRVLPPLRGLGLGSRLIRAAEAALRERGFRCAEIGVEKGNTAARRLYERLGYRVHRELEEEYEFTPPGGTRVTVPVDEWMMRKPL
jgi:ribosomal protein S18 acetylase RimI-like enzyme